MTTWQYHVEVKDAEQPFFVSRLLPMQVGFAAQREWGDLRYYRTEDFLSYLGSQGWELVSVYARREHSGTQHMEEVWVFKRPVG